MPNLTIKNLPVEVYERLRERARRHRRSLNREVIHTLEGVVLHRPVDPEELLEEIDRFREGLKGWPRMTQKRLREAKEEGRP